MFCIFCGTENGEKSHFCTRCGKEINNISTPVRKMPVYKSAILLPDFQPDKRKRTLFTVLIIFALILSLITVACYGFGYRPVQSIATNEQGPNYIHHYNFHVTQAYMDNVNNRDFVFGEDFDELWDYLDESIAELNKYMLLYVVISLVLIAALIMVFIKPRFSDIYMLLAGAVGLSVVIYDFNSNQGSLHHAAERFFTLLFATNHHIPLFTTIPLFTVFSLMLFFSVVYSTQKFTPKKFYPNSTQRHSAAHILLCAVLVISGMVSLWVTGRYIAGSNPEIYTYNMDYTRTRGVDAIVYQKIGFYENLITLNNLWDEKTVTDIFQDSVVTFRMSFAIAYFIIALLLIVSFLLAIHKKKKVKLITIIVSFLGLFIMITEFILGYFILKYNYLSISVYPEGYYRFIPCYPVSILLPLIATIPVLSSMLPAQIPNHS